MKAKLQPIFFALSVTMLASCGSDDSTDDSSTESLYTFDGHVNDILKSSCGGSGCHEAGSTASTPYVDDRTAFIAAKSTIIERINLSASDSRFMPQNQSRTLTSADKAILEAYLNQSTQN